MQHRPRSDHLGATPSPRIDRVEKKNPREREDLDLKCRLAGRSVSPRSISSSFPVYSVGAVEIRPDSRVRVPRLAKFCFISHSNCKNQILQQVSPLQSQGPSARRSSRGGGRMRGSEDKVTSVDTVQIDTSGALSPKSLRNFLARRKGSVQKMKDRGLV